MIPDRPETYEEANARLSRTLGERAEGSIRGMGAEDDLDPVASVQGARVGGITFRSEPPAAIQFIVDAPSKTVTLRVKQAEAEGDDFDGVGSLFYHPFQVSLFDISDAAAPKATINATSRLYKSIGTSAGDLQSITDLTTDITLASNTHVWVSVTVSTLAITAAAIETGTAWPTLIVTSGTPAAQTEFNVPIGKVRSSSPGKPGFEFTISGTKYHFEQCLFSHILSEERCENGVPVLYGFPIGGGS